jgi:hypothetical protein
MKKFEIPIHIQNGIKLVLIAALFVWNLIEGSVYQNQYPLVMVHVYPIAIWRIALIVLIILASDWCPSLTLMLMYFVFFYIMDMEITIEKWSLADLKKKSPSAK